MKVLESLICVQSFYLITFDNCSLSLGTLQPHVFQMFGSDLHHDTVVHNDWTKSTCTAFPTSIGQLDRIHRFCLLLAILIDSSIYHYKRNLCMYKSTSVAKTTIQQLVNKWFQRCTLVLLQQQFNHQGWPPRLIPKLRTTNLSSEALLRVSSLDTTNPPAGGLAFKPPGLVATMRFDSEGRTA